MKKAFTLAEVLITLTVIGIITSLTIPSLLIDSQEKHFYTSAKKSMSNIQQALNLIKANSSDYSFFDFGKTDSDMMNAFTPFLSPIKTGTRTEIFTNGGTYYHYKSASTSLLTQHPSALLSDGSFIMYINSSNNCTDISNTLENICGFLCVDTNGEKSPNMVGRDLLFFWIINKSGTYVTIPLGSNNDAYSCVVGSSTWEESDGCTAYRILNKAMPE